ncbi:MAG: hypothetical protein DCC65_07875 [Planctomycetota bacterium]|nr:MAG: hypothetical protein DCC65_07875 [Planctomycetota bacterium]
MENNEYEGRKSRIFNQKVGRAPVWRSVGSITIVSPDLEKPLFLEETGYTVFLHEAKDNSLRDAIIVLKRWQRTDDWKFRFWLFFAAVLGIALVRAWYSLSAF